MSRATPFLRPLLAAATLAALAGCSQTPENLFVLLDPPSGGASSIEVTTPQGTQVLDQPGQATGFDDPNTPPIAPISLRPDQIEDVFAGAFSATPSGLKEFTLYFKTGTSILTPESKALLPQVIAVVQETEAPRISVVGHTDREGAASVNARLALNRATSIRDLLIDEGAPPELIETTSHGEANPVVPTADGVSEPQNRRVEILVR